MSASRSRSEKSLPLRPSETAVAAWGPCGKTIVVQDLEGSTVERLPVVIDEWVFVDVAAVDLYHFGEIGGRECRFRLPSAGSPCRVVYRNGDRWIDVDNRLRWNHAPDRGEDVAFQALKVALSVERAQIRKRCFEVPLPQPLHHRPPIKRILGPT